MKAATVSHRLRLVRPTPARAKTAAPRLQAAPVLRTAAARDAHAIHALVLEHLAEGHLLPRPLDEIEAHIGRFVVAVSGITVVACAELAPLSSSMAEVRSLIVSAQARKLGVGLALVNELGTRAAAAGFTKLCAFAHSPGYFVHMGFSIIPHVWLPEKVEKDCRACPQFRRCGQYAVIRELSCPRDAYVPLAALHG